jgi:hypothetical protein
MMGMGSDIYACKQAVSKNIRREAFVPGQRPVKRLISYVCNIRQHR